jgi:sensor histidine kinase YesM
LLRGFAPERVGLLFAISVTVAARPALWNFEPDSAADAIKYLASYTARNFASGLPLLILLSAAEHITARSSWRRRVAYLAAAVVAGSVAYSALVCGIRQLGGWESNLQFNIASFIRALVLGTLFAAILFFADLAKKSQQRLHREQLSKIELERQFAQSRLSLLQTQIEPHFLFNSLALIQRHYQTAPERGRTLLQHLMKYLRVATTRMREREVRLDGEFALARTFLAICRERMGGRLRVQITLPGELESALVPPLMVITLVENAVKHGVGPRDSGGTVRIDATKVGHSVEIRVSDDGVGFRALSGCGVGLSNTRGRLAALFGDGAGLELSSMAGGGTLALLRVPYRLDSPGGRS